MRKIILFLADILILYVSLIVALFLRYGAVEANAQLSVHFVPFTAIFVVWLLAMYIANLYDHHSLRNTREFFQSLLQVTIAATVISIIFFYTVPAVGIAPKTNLLIFAVVFLILQTCSRYLYNHALAQRARRNILIVDTSPGSLELARVIRDNPQFGYAVMGLVDLGRQELPLNGDDDFKVMNGMDALHEALVGDYVDTVVLGPQAYRAPEVIDRLFEAIHRGVNFIDLPSFSERLTGKVPVGAISRVWFLENLSEGSKRAYGVAKRALDTTFSVLAGIPALVAFPFIAIIIKLDSPGPVLFRQSRTGQGGKVFSIVKFRTMRADAEARTGAVWAKENDPRVTRLGRLLRKTRIDELPQLWNIIRGQMSLVGPRAERPEIDERLAQEVPFYKQRYLIKPGLSGWAQIKYQYGASVRDSTEKLQYDLYYIKHRSLMLDLEIILKTLAISLRQQGR
jgi:exopolysaccharide biosynthesis polyprenyl glycosylphosphotransferase